MANSRNNWGLLILAGVGAGTLAGAVIGLTLGRRAGHPGEIVETVDDLKRKADLVLEELSENVADLVGQSRALLHETRAQVEALQENSLLGVDKS